MTEEEPVIKTGTIVRFPIVVQGFIEMRGLKEVRVVVDPYDWEYSAWPRVSAYGEDQFIVQLDDGPETVMPAERARRIEGDADIVESLRAIAERKGMDNDTPWHVSRGINEGITAHTDDQ